VQKGGAANVQPRQQSSTLEMLSTAAATATTPKVHNSGSHACMPGSPLCTHCHGRCACKRSAATPLKQGRQQCSNNFEAGQTAAAVAAGNAKSAAVACVDTCRRLQ
jgi:hypothetical protein